MSSSGILQVVNKDGEYATEDVEEFVTATGLDRANVNYLIVAIMGPQSSGKSTLLNNVFGTKFVEMDALSGRQQTTRGIWMARSPKLSSQVLVMDLEGSDGRERGEDDTSFERQSALFALAAADVMLINMWAKDIGRETGSGKPLLKTIFQVNLKLFTPAPGRKRTVLLFIFRDRTRTPLSRLIETWEEDLGRMWAAIPKPPQYDATSVSDFFDVQYASLPNFEDREEDFKAESVLLRRRFTDAEEDSLVRVSDDKLPAQALPLHLQSLWQVIREQKDLNLPAHKVMVANIRCAEIAKDQLKAFLEDQAWQSLQKEADAGIVSDFGARATALLQSCLSGYDEEARYFEASVRTDKRKDLVSSAFAAVADVRNTQLVALRAIMLQRFKTDMTAALEAEPKTFSASAIRVTAECMGAFVEAANNLDVDGSGWTIEEGYDLLEKDIATEVQRMKEQQVKGAAVLAEERMRELITGSAIPLLDSTPHKLWLRLQQLLSTAADDATRVARSHLQGFDLRKEEMAAQDKRFTSFAQEQVEGLVREASHTVLSRMKDRFNELFSRNDEGLPRSWNPRVNVSAVAAESRRGAAQVLALLAIIRFDMPADACATIDAAVASLVEQLERRASRAGSMPAASALDSVNAGDRAGFDMLSASEWPAVGKRAVLLSPGQCRNYWRQFLSDSNFIVQQAVATQEANRAASNRTPPLWAIAAMIVLGWNEFFSILRNPLLLLFVVLLFLFGKTVYQDLEVDTEMQRGLLPGLLVLGGKLVPTLRSAFGRTIQGAFQSAQEVPQQAQRALNAVRTSPTSQAPNHNTVAGSGESLRQRRGDVEMTQSSFASPQSQRVQPNEERHSGDGWERMKSA